MYKAKDKNVCFTTNRLWAISAVLISAVFDVEVVVPVTEACSSTRSYHQHGSVIFVLAF